MLTGNINKACIRFKYLFRQILCSIFNKCFLYMYVWLYISIVAVNVYWQKRNNIVNTSLCNASVKLTSSGIVAILCLNVYWTSTWITSGEDKQTNVIYDLLCWHRERNVHKQFPVLSFRVCCKVSVRRLICIIS